MTRSTRWLSLLFGLAAVALLAASPADAQQKFTFEGVTLGDGSASIEGASIQVRVKESAGGGYTRADYFDPAGRRLGFYEAFEVVSLEEAALRAWAVSNFPDRTGGGGR